MGKKETIYIAILRGINVSGQKIIRMESLKELFVSLGFNDVVTFIQSGNIIFRSAEKSRDRIVLKITCEIKKVFGFDVPVIIRTSDELKEILAENPFLAEKGILTDKLHVTLLSEVPSSENIKKLDGLTSGNDRFVLKGKEVYLYCPGGYGNTKFSNNAFENKLKVTATTRNWNTVNKLLELSIQHPASRI